jgi:hypothetical protein
MSGCHVRVFQSHYVGFGVAGGRAVLEQLFIALTHEQPMIDTPTASWLLSLCAVADLPGRLVAIAVTVALPHHRVIGSFACALAAYGVSACADTHRLRQASMASLSACTHVWHFAIAMAGNGAAYGYLITTWAICTLTVFGTAHFGRVHGAAVLSGAVASVCMPLAAGYLIDTYSVAPAMFMAGCVLVFSAACGGAIRCVIAAGDLQL